MPNGSDIEKEDAFMEVKPEVQVCSICLEDVDADDVTANGVPNCVTCKNGHFLHRECYEKMNNRLCPSCREPLEFNCRGAFNRYFQVQRRGGYKKMKKSMKKRRSMKKRKSIKKKGVKKHKHTRKVF